MLHIRADLSPSQVTGSAADGRGLALGFLIRVGGSSSPRNRFSGLVLDAAGNLNLVQDPNDTGVFGTGSYLGIPVAFAGGTFNPSAFHALSYDVDTSSGYLSNIRLSGSTADYTDFESIRLLDNSFIGHAGIYGSSSTANGYHAFDNFEVSTTQTLASLSDLQLVLLRPLSATANSTFDVCTVDKTISGEGLAYPLPSGTPYPSTFPAHDCWNTKMYISAPGVYNPEMEFSLSGNFELHGFHLWNFNAGEAATRSIKTADILVREAGGVYTSVVVKAIQYRPGTASTEYAGEDYVFATPVKAAYVKINIVTNYGDVSCSGFSEIRFVGRIPRQNAKRFIVQPVQAQASSSYSTMVATKTIDGSGLSSDLATGSDIPLEYPVHSANNTDMWLSNNQKPATNTFDLGRAYTLTGFHLWNHNETGNSVYRSMSNFVMSVSGAGPIDGSGFVEVSLGADTALRCGKGAGSDPGETYSFSQPVKARFVRLAALSNWGTSGYIGFSEIRFVAERAPAGTVIMML
ncbi:MAG: discoidin domain-containing protein [Kiritimatiellae bacterium]|nr:discoidin domain-containing protein [Kiritimatiellia bacterium]